MPIYVYEILRADGTAGEIFEIEQPASDPALTTHPLTGEKIRRVFLPPNLTTQYGERGIRDKVSDADNLARLGFTRYEKDKLTGTYHKTAGTDSRAPESF